MMSPSNKQECYIGVDPGARGSICMLWPGASIAFCDTKQLPAYICCGLTSIRENVVRACMEKNHAIYGSAAKSTWGFGYNTGILMGIFLVADYTVELITPKIWQAHLGIKEKDSKLRKKATAEKVTELYKDLLPKTNGLYGPQGGLLDGRSDALAIAHYAYTTHGENDGNST